MTNKPLEKHLEFRIPDSAERLTCELKGLQQASLALDNEIIKNITYYLTSKLLKSIDDISSSDSSLLNKTSNLRYVLEALIVTELLLLEETYSERLYYIVHKHDLSKLEKLIIILEKNIDIVSSYEEKDNQITKQYTERIKAVKSNKIELKSLIQEMENKSSQLYKEIQEELIGFFELIDYHGFSYQKHVLTNKILPKYQSRKREVEDLMNKLSSRLSKDSRLDKAFEFRRQPSRVFKKLHDSRSWNEKAKVVGLEEEYTFIYDYTSALMHCTSFSILSNAEFQGQEDYMMQSKSYKYLNRAINNLYQYTGIKKPA